MASSQPAAASPFTLEPARRKAFPFRPLTLMLFCLRLLLRSLFAQQGKKSFLEEGTPFQETIDGLLGLMPVGARNVTYLPAEAVAELQNGSEKDIGQLKGVQSWSHGPYLDDWSKVPAEIASQYNTSPTFGK